MEVLVGKSSLYSNYLVQSSFHLVWERRSHTYFFSTTHLGFFRLHVHNVIPCLRPLPTEPSPEDLDLRLWRGLDILKFDKKSTDL